MSILMKCRRLLLLSLGTPAAFKTWLGQIFVGTPLPPIRIRLTYLFFVFLGGGETSPGTDEFSARSQALAEGLRLQFVTLHSKIRHLVSK